MYILQISVLDCNDVITCTVTHVVTGNGACPSPSPHHNLSSLDHKSQSTANPSGTVDVCTVLSCGAMVLTGVTYYRTISVMLHRVKTKERGRRDEEIRIGKET